MGRSIETLAQRMKLARDKRGLTQGELADLAGMKQPDISKIERGLIQQTTGIARLAAALNVPVGWLEEGSGEEPLWDGALTARESGSPTYGVAHSLSPASFQTAPCLTWEQLMTQHRDKTLPASFIAAAPDDAMAPLARAGHEFLFRPYKPGESLKPGTGVLVEDKHGLLYLREYQEKRGPGLWEANARHEAYRSLQSDVDELRIVAVLRAPMRGWEDL